VRGLSLVFANRHTGGGDYDQLEAALDRLTGTRLRTSIRTGGEKQDAWFGLVDSAYVKRKERADGSDGRVMEMRITLSDWLFNAVTANEVLSMHPDYFRLRKRLNDGSTKLPANIVACSRNGASAWTFSTRKPDQGVRSSNSVFGQGIGGAPAFA
jgi:plasmid replication initiation protein